MIVQVIPSSLNKCLEKVYIIRFMTASNNVSEVIKQYFST